MTQPSRSLAVLVTGALVAVGTPVLAVPPEPSSTQDLAESRQTVRDKEQQAERVASRLRQAKAELVKLGERAEKAQKQYDEAATALKRTRNAFTEARQQVRTAKTKHEAAQAEAAPAESVRPESAPLETSTAQSVQPEEAGPEDAHAEKPQVEAAETEGDERDGREASGEGDASRYLTHSPYAKYARYLARSMTAESAEKAEGGEAAEAPAKPENVQEAVEAEGVRDSEKTEDDQQGRTESTATDVRQDTALEKLETVYAQALSRRTEARRAYVDQKTEFAEAEQAKKAADKAYEEQKEEVAQLRARKKRLFSALARTQNGVVFLADRRAENTQTAVAKLKKGKKRHFARGAARGRLVVQSALKWIGTPYSWGGGNSSGPSFGIGRGARTRGFDCSGLALYAWAQAGVKLDHYTGSQWNSGPRIPLSMVNPGDLLFFAGNTKNPDTIHHVGIFVGRGQMVEAPYTGARVRVTSMWRKSLIGAVRPA
ncbi:NlpC/P60 family protein [Actinocorallia libanotica]|uniref:NlpC/P60 domain-containing protein n=1 Tax=Actinocorallia libanotica TaxID=46162 RepID=A0ABN1RR60_9ACTN